MGTHDEVAHSTAFDGRILRSSALAQPVAQDWFCSNGVFSSSEPF
jgi:hypothetical protein